MDWRNQLEKKSDYNNEKKMQKNQRQIAACEQEPTRDAANFCSNAVFSLYFKISGTN